MSASTFYPVRSILVLAAYAILGILIGFFFSHAGTETTQVWGILVSAIILPTLINTLFSTATKLWPHEPTERESVILALLGSCLLLLIACCIHGSFPSPALWLIPVGGAGHMLFWLLFIKLAEQNSARINEGISCFLMSLIFGSCVAVLIALISLFFENYPSEIVTGILLGIFGGGTALLAHGDGKKLDGSLDYLVTSGGAIVFVSTVIMWLLFLTPLAALLGVLYGIMETVIIVLMYKLGERAYYHK